MDQFIQFIIDHWMLLAALVLIIILLVYEETRRTVGGVQQISVPQVTNLINHEAAVVVDVRAAANFQEGHVLSAINLPLTEFENNLNKLNKYKSKPIILVNDTGQASIRAGAILRKQGFEKVYALAGGITTWQKEGLPLVKD